MINSCHRNIYVSLVEEASEFYQRACDFEIKTIYEFKIYGESDIGRLFMVW